MIHRRRLMAAGLAGGLTAALARTAAAEGAVARPPPVSTVAPSGPPDLEELMRKPVSLDAALSPDGERIALLREQRRDGKRLAYLLISATKTLMTEPSTQAVLGDYNVEKVEWASNDRLLVWVLYDKDKDGKPFGINFYGILIPIPVRRVLSVEPTGKNAVMLFSGPPTQNTDLGQVVDMTPDDPRSVIMQAWNYDKHCWALHRVDIYTGQAALMELGTPATDAWYLQGGVPILRLDTNRRKTVATVYSRAPGQTDWVMYRKFRRDEGAKLKGFDVVAATPDPGILLVAGRAEGDDAATLRRFDCKDQALGEVVARQPGHDIVGVFTDDRWNLIGARWIDDRVTYQFAEKDFAPHFRGMSNFLENKANIDLFDIDDSHRRFLAKVHGPTQPGAYYLYDRQTKSFDLLAETRPWLTDRLAPMESLKLKARDGAPLTAYLSTPRGKGPWPLIVLPHGGPEVRDLYQFDLWVQVLAAQGWAVLQPNFRGSGGYGQAFADAGRRHWGDLMQDDVDDCVDQVLAGGRIDAGRVAICGISYGGYAATMGALRRPQLYRCAVSVAGLSDLLQAIADVRREDGSDAPTYEYVLRTVGDPKTDKAMLQAASPRLRAAEFQIPLLLIHGSADETSFPAQSRDMAKAMKKAGKPCEYLEVPGMGHPNWPDSQMKILFNKLILFLEEHLKAKA